jgi:MAST domain-containing protein
LPAGAQLDRGKGMGSGTGPMKHKYGFEQYDSRFEEFESKTFKEVADIFGIPVEDAISDLDLPEDIDTQLTIFEVEEQYGVSGQEVASYMIMNTNRMNISHNSRDKLLMRQQAIQTMRKNTGQGMFFVRQGSLAYGNFTTFNFNESGAIENFAAGGDLIFDSVTISDFNYIDEQINGATAFYQGADSQIFLQDSPMGIFQIRALANKTITFDLSEKVKASQEKELSNYSEDILPIKITKNDFEGYLVIFINPHSADPEKTLEGVNVEISGDKIRLKLVKNGVVMFRANSIPHAFMQTQYKNSPGYIHMHQVLSRGISTGRVGAEIALRNGTDQESFVNYVPIKLHVRDRDRNRIVLGVESETQENMIITVNVDNETIDLSRPEHIRLRYDGAVIKEANSIDELFAGGETPLYYMLEENGTATMAVYIPKFSEHEIIIDLVPEGEENNSEIEENTSQTGENTLETEESILENGEKETENGETETRNGSRLPAESTPAFGFGFAVAGLAAAYGLKQRL